MCVKMTLKRDFFCTTMTLYISRREKPCHKLTPALFKRAFIHQTVLSMTDFGIFTDFFDSNKYYLLLLSLQGKKVTESTVIHHRKLITSLSEPLPSPWLNLEKCQNNISNALLTLIKISEEHSTQRVNNECYRLLKENNWRLHLPAILMCYIIQNRIHDNILTKLWDRAENSMVSPQVCTILSFIDSQFTTKAKKILEENSDFYLPPETAMFHKPIENKNITALRYLITADLNLPLTTLGGNVAQNWSKMIHFFFQRETSPF